MVEKISISLDTDVFKKIEKMRGNRTQFRSKYINSVLRKALNLTGTEEKKIIAPVPTANHDGRKPATRIMDVPAHDQ